MVNNKSFEFLAFVLHKNPMTKSKISIGIPLTSWPKTTTFTPLGKSRKTFSLRAMHVCHFLQKTHTRFSFFTIKLCIFLECVCVNTSWLDYLQRFFVDFFPQLSIYIFILFFSFGTDVDGANAQGYDTGIGGSTSTIVSPLGSPQPQLRSHAQRNAALARYMQVSAYSKILVLMDTHTSGLGSASSLVCLP